MGGAMNESDKTPRRSIKKARCAIYTRKSSEEGLEQALGLCRIGGPQFVEDVFGKSSPDADC
jgi:hypothetical protein